MNKKDRYDSLIKYYSERYGLGWQLIKNQMLAESDGHPDAISPVAAKGVAQFMPNSWQQWDDQDDLPVTDKMINDLLEDLEELGVEVDKEKLKKHQIKKLMQELMDHPYNPEEAIEAMCRYMEYLYGRFSEIPDTKERYKMALASYNAGRGNINQMLAHARKATGLPFSYAKWKEAGEPAGEWQTWEFARRFLSIVTGDHSRETIGYVKKIIGE